MTLVIISEYVGGTRRDRLLKHRKHGSEAWSILMEARINKVMKAVLTSRMTKRSSDVETTRKRSIRLAVS